MGEFANDFDEVGEIEDPLVTMVELDSGPFEMAFVFVAIGVPRFSDVDSVAGSWRTEAEAVLVGARWLQLGLWSSFHVRKDYAKVPLTRAERDALDEIDGLYAREEAKRDAEEFGDA